MASTHPTVMRKGKRTAPGLPKAALRLIADSTTSDMNVYIPACFGDETWGTQVWRVLHVARALATLRSVSRAWRDTADEHPAWRQLCLLLDPHGIYSQVPPGHVPAIPGADTFRRIIRSTCLVCTMSCPDHLVFRRRSARLPPVPTYPTPSALLGVIAACATHRPLVFCARCLRSEPSTLGMAVAPHLAIAPLAANERDSEFVRGLDLRSNSGAGVRAVCGGCRGERIRHELVRGRGANMAPWMGSGFWDWEWEGKPVGDGWPVPWDGGLRARDVTRLLRSEDVAGVVNQYIEYGDWTVREAVEEMEERVWMRWWTKSIEMEGLVRATARLQRMEERAAEPLDTDDESDEEDDLLSLSDEFGLREMIFQDWARNRILEGIWLSPHNDMAQYYAAATNNPEMRSLPPAVAPRHPLGLIERAPPTLPRQFTWSVLVRASDEAPHRQMSPNSRPSQRRYIRTAANFYLSNPPPPNRLVYHLARAWEQGLRSVLSPAISNVVGRIVKECEVTQKFIQEAQWEEDVDRRNRQWLILRTQCILARGERDPCKAVARIGPDQLVEILRGPEAWVEGGGWEDIRAAWDDEIDEVERMREMARMRSRERDSMAPSPPPSTILSVSAPSPTDTTRTSPDVHTAPSPDLHAHADIHSSSTPSPESVTSPTTPSPEALRSPSTMRTTPSPPPSVDGSKKGLMNASESDIEAEIRASRLPPPSPLTKKPLHPIPLIPATSHHLGQQTKIVLEMLWREATGGLWMCRCGICVRAMSVQGVPTLFTAQVQTQQPQPEDWSQPEPMQVEEPVEGKGKGVAGRRSRERDETDEGERKRIKCVM